MRLDGQAPHARRAGTGAPAHPTLAPRQRRRRDDRAKACAREVLQVGELDPIEGLVGDGWRLRGSSRTPDGSAHRDMQIAIMSVRVIDLIRGRSVAMGFAGDQLFVDLDLGRENLPPGARLAVGTAIVEITAKPHRSCKKFAARFGVDAVAFMSDRRYRGLELRGIYAKVVHRGRVRLHDTGPRTVRQVTGRDRSGGCDGPSRRTMSR
jgi:hypothetical protein